MREDAAKVWSKEEQAEHRRKWVAALRSGEYAQAKEALREPAEQRLDGKVGYCCLGVACEVAIQNGVDFVRLNPNDPADYEYWGWKDETDYNEQDEPIGSFDWQDEQDAELPPALKQYYGITSTGTLLEEAYKTDDSGTRRDLIGLNDNDWTFEQIAGVIEEGKFVEPDRDDERLIGYQY